MQDRFKFRAWHKEKQEMHNIEGLYAYDSEYTEGGEVFFKEDSSPKNSYYFPEEVELMQCTGLKDKNGVLIFEGDIVSVLQDENSYVINYSDDRAMFTIENKAIKICCNFDNYWASELEVLGNIYHNKELLNEVGN